MMSALPDIPVIPSLHLWDRHFLRHHWDHRDRVRLPVPGSAWGSNSVEAVLHFEMFWKRNPIEFQTKKSYHNTFIKNMKETKRDVDKQ